MKELELHINPSETLAKDFSIGLRNLASNRPLTIFMDTYEIIESIDSCVRTMIKESGSRVIWVIASRKNLLSNQYVEVTYEQEFPEQIIDFPIPELSYQEASDLFATHPRNQFLQDCEKDAIYRATLGVPLALSIVVDLLAEGVNLDEIIAGAQSSSRKDIVSQMTRHILRFARNDDKRSLYLLAMQRRQDDATVQEAVLRNNQNRFALNSWLGELAQRYSSIIFSGEYYLHEAVATFMREYLLSPAMRLGDDEVKHIASLAVSASKNRLEEIEKNLSRIKDHCGSEDWQEAILDFVYWSFWKNENEGWNIFAKSFIAALGYQPELARNLLDVILNIKGCLNRDGMKRLETIQRGIPQLEYDGAFFFSPRISEKAAIKAMLEELEKLLNRQLDKTNTEYQAILDLLFSRLN